MKLLEWIFVIVIIGIIIYTFRGQAVPIVNELKQTTLVVLVAICVMVVCYHLIEGWITMTLAKQYRQDFTWRMGITNAFLCSFYRVATLGSGAGIAAIVYLGEKGIGYSKGFGLYMLQYTVHKCSIAIFSLLLFVSCFPYMNGHFGEYQWFLAAGYGITAIVAGGLILFMCSKRFHQVILRFLGFLNEKCRGRFTEQVIQLGEECAILEKTSHILLKKPALILKLTGLSLFKSCFYYSIPYFTLRTECDITFLETMGITSLAVMLAAVLPSPAGIGSTEVVFTTLASEITDVGVAGSAALLYRFGTFVFPFLVGGMIVMLRRIRRHKYQKKCVKA